MVWLFKYLTIDDFFSWLMQRQLCSLHASFTTSSQQCRTTAWLIKEPPVTWTVCCRCCSWPKTSEQLWKGLLRNPTWCRQRHLNLVEAKVHLCISDGSNSFFFRHNPDTDCIDRHLASLFDELQERTSYTYKITHKLGIDRGTVCVCTQNNKALVG